MSAFCDSCGSKVSSYRHGCPRCSAPQCCQRCCDSATIAALEAENARLRELVQCLLDNDPEDMAADAITVLQVWRKDAARALGREAP